jgi:hypothetical protein
VLEINIRVNEVCNVKKIAFGKYVFFNGVHFPSSLFLQKAFSVHIGHLSRSHSGYDSVIPMCVQHYGRFSFKTDGTNI